MKRFQRRPKTIGRIPNGTVVYAIGDIHGRKDLLESLHERIEQDASKRDADDVILVYIGDYIDRGPQSRETIDLLIRGPLPGTRQVFLMGNHEQAMIGFMDGDTALGEAWIAFGGLATIASYGGSTGATNATMPDLDAIREHLLVAIPPEHMAFLRSLETCFRCGSYMFVHAGIRPRLAMAKQTRDDMLWIRDDFLQSLHDHGAIVVHGHSIVTEVEFAPNRIAIDTGAYATGILSSVVLEAGERFVLHT